MGNVEWFEQATGDSTSAQWHRGPQPTGPELPVDDAPPVQARRRTWPYATVIAALVISGACVWQAAENDRQDQERKEEAAAYKGVSATVLNIDGIEAETLAVWSKNGRSVALSTHADWEAKLVRIDSGDQTAKEESSPLKPGQFPMPVHLELKVPVKDWYQAVRLTVTVGGPQWKPGSPAMHRSIEFRPDRTAIDAETGKILKQSYSRLF
ncbi:hypothetical protein ACJ6WF_49430 [Streptomyces sp. MMS24-I2-30]|uniref:hypothetical protein n=1 Tax=Streptomyces sp. MMS24-I2-30 TaxID=3351564 RepID=UPI003896EB35